MIQNLLFLSHKDIGTLYLRSNFSTTSFRLSSKGGRINRSPVEDHTSKDKQAISKKRESRTRALEALKILRNKYPLHKYNWEAKYKDFVFFWRPLTVVPGLIFMYINQTAFITDRNRQKRFLELLFNIMQAKTRSEVLDSHKAMWKFLVVKTNTRAKQIDYFETMLYKAYKGKL